METLGVPQIIIPKPVISKVYEKVFIVNSMTISPQIIYYHHHNLALDQEQASTEHALLKFTDNILKCFDDNKVGIATYMNHSKVFDCVDHKTLLTKIKRRGVPPTPRGVLTLNVNKPSRVRTPPSWCPYP